MQGDGWRTVAAAQDGLITREQLRACGVARWSVQHRIATERWVQHTPTVIGVVTGPLSPSQQRWLGVLHAGGVALLGGLSAAGEFGLANWERPKVTVLIGKDQDVGAGHPLIDYRRTRRDLGQMRHLGRCLPTAQLEPSLLLFASWQRSARTADGIIAAAVQQRLTTPDALAWWLERLTPIRGAARFRRALLEIGEGAHSRAEMDVRRLCRTHGLKAPDRQIRRRGSDGRCRFTDCEWQVGPGVRVVLEVDGAFHMDVAHWEDDIARQRSLTERGLVVVRCTARELRDEPARVAHDLRRLGVPPALSG